MKISVTRFAWVTSVLVVILGMLLPVFGHVADTSLLRVTVEETGGQMEWNVDLGVIHRGVGLDLDGDGWVDREEVKRADAKVSEWLGKVLGLRMSGKEVQVRGWIMVGWEGESGRIRVEEMSKVHGVWRGTWNEVQNSGANSAELLRGVRVLGSGFDVWGQAHRVLVRVQKGDRVVQGVLSDAQREFEGSKSLGGDSQLWNEQSERNLVGGEASERGGSAGGGAWKGFLQMGVMHILEGLDHLLFLGMLVVVIRSWRDLWVVVTAFTVAHSVTLCLASMGAVHLPTRLVECGVALSIGWMAVENLRNREQKWRVGWTFGFGLVHGVAFAEVLVGDVRSFGDLWKDLVAFNVGVELGQLLVVTPIVPLILMMRGKSWELSVVKVVSWIGLAASCFWFFERALG